MKIPTCAEYDAIKEKEKQKRDAENKANVPAARKQIIEALSEGRLYFGTEFSRGVFNLLKDELMEAGWTFDHRASVMSSWPTIYSVYLIDIEDEPKEIDK